MDSLRNLSIKSKLLILVATFLLGLIALGFVFWTTLAVAKVTGPLYEQIIRDKELLAHVLPPPACLLETYLIAHQMCNIDDVHELQLLIEQYNELKHDYFSTLNAWDARELHPATRNVLIHESLPPAKSFFNIMEEQLIPAVLRHDKSEAFKILTTQLALDFNEHRDAIDNVVMRTSQSSSLYEATAADLIAWRSNVLLGTEIAVFIFGCIVAFYIITPIVVQMRNLTATIKAVAHGDLSHRMETTGKGEFGYLALSINEMITSLVEAKVLADAACTSKSEFLANMSHEIRTPLTAIMGYCDILRDDGIIERAPPRRIQTIQTIRRAGEHLLTVINDILDLSKIEAGKFQIEQIETPLPQILIEVDSLMRPRLTNKNVELRISLANSIPDRIISDPTRLRQILLNLVGNAVKFTEKGFVVVRTRVQKVGDQSNLRIEVEDTGSGMTADEAAPLFKPFNQADASVTRRHGGTGLGLTISRRLARMMGGDVELAYTAPGKGSLFVLELPLVNAPNCSMVNDLYVQSYAQNEVMSAKELSLTGRILLAEDGEDNQQLISFYLTRAGAEIEIADNGRIALEMLESAAARGRPFELLLSDMQMPEMDGYTLARTLRTQGNHIPIVALTAHAMAEDRQKCLDAGCSDYASKPINKVALISTCFKWLQASRTTTTSEVEANEKALPEKASRPSRSEILVSDLADDPEMAILIDSFLSKLHLKVARINECLTTRRLNELSRLAHQLKGAGGGYGFPIISDSARRVEQIAGSDSDLEQVQLAVAELTSLCQMAIAGGTGTTVEAVVLEQAI